MSSKSGIITSLVIIIVVFGTVGGYLYVTDPFAPPRVAVVLKDPGFGDWGFADNVRIGRDNASWDMAVEFEYPDELPTNVDEARTAIIELAQSNTYVLILVVGEEFAPALVDAAEDYPDQKFGMIGADVDAPNVMSVSFATEEAAFLAGTLAAAEASAHLNHSFLGNYKTIGILAAIEGDLIIDRMINGFIEGATAANVAHNLNVTILPVQYVGSLGDNDTAHSMASSMFNESHVSVLFAPVRASIHGVKTAANFTDNEVSYWQYFGRPIIIAAGLNLDYYGCNRPEIPVAPSYIGTSVISEAGRALLEILTRTFWDEFEGGWHEEYTLGNGVDITDLEFSSTYLNDFTMDVIADFRADIISGTIVVTSP